MILLRTLPLLLVAACASQPGELTGPVDKRMADQVAAELAAGRRDFTITSPGGSVFISAVIAGAIKGSGATLLPSGKCQSACALMVEAVNDGRIAGVEIHGAFGSPTARQDAIDWLVASGISRDVAEKWSGPNLHRLTAEEVRR